MSLRRSSGLRNERGVASLYMVGVMIIGLLLLGLIVDGGQIRTARRYAADVAEQSARFGAQEVDDDELRATGAVILNQAAAQQAAAQYAQSRGATVSVSAVGTEVTVTVQMQVDLTLLSSLIGQVTATRTVDALDGVASATEGVASGG